MVIMTKSQRADRDFMIVSLSPADGGKYDVAQHERHARASIPYSKVGLSLLRPSRQQSAATTTEGVEPPMTTTAPTSASPTLTGVQRRPPPLRRPPWAIDSEATQRRNVTKPFLFDTLSRGNASR